MAARLGLLLARHTAFAAVVVPAVWLRVITTKGYPGGLWFGDSGKYLENATHLTPGSWHTSGYSILLSWVRPWHSLTAVVVLQHAMGVATGVLIYLLLRNRGVTALWATLAAVPALLEARLIQLETMLVSEAAFIFCTMLGLTLGLWRFHRARWAYWITAPAAGLVVAAATVIRPPAAIVLVLLAARLLYRRKFRWYTIALVLGFAVPVGSYLVWFNDHHGRYAMSNSDGLFLYGRTAAFADCAKVRPPAEEAFLCRTPLPPGSGVAPGFSAVWGGWGTSSAFRLYGGPEAGGAPANDLAKSFAKRAIMAQPGDYLKVVWRDTVRSFRATDSPYPTPATPIALSFPRTVAPMTGNGAVLVGGYLGRPYAGPEIQPRVVEPYAGRIREYKASRWTALPGPALLIVLLAAPFGMVLRRQWLALVPWLTAWSFLVIPAVISDFDPRYVPPAVPFAVLALGLAPPWRVQPHRWRAPAAGAAAGAAAFILAVSMLITWPGSEADRTATSRDERRRQLVASLEHLRDPSGLFRPTTGGTDRGWVRTLPFVAPERLDRLYASYLITRIRTDQGLPAQDPRLVTGLQGIEPVIRREMALNQLLWLSTLKTAGGSVEPSLENRIRARLPQALPPTREVTKGNARHWLLIAQLVRSLQLTPPAIAWPDLESWTGTKVGRSAHGVILEAMGTLGLPVGRGDWQPSFAPEVHWDSTLLARMEGASAGLAAARTPTPDGLRLIVTTRLDRNRGCPGAPGLYRMEVTGACDVLATYYALRIERFTSQGGG